MSTVAVAVESGAYDANWLREQLRARGVPLAELNVAASLDSTNADALLRAESLPLERFVVSIADTQTAGRGRRGRRWESPPGGSIYLSIGWRSALPLDYEPTALPLAIGVAVADALFACTGLKLALKWPNDLYLDAGKLGGILLESRVSAHAMSVVAGIGINHLRDASVMDKVDQPVGFLDDHAPGHSRQMLAVETIAACARAIDGFRRNGLAPFRAAWLRYDMLRDRSIRVQDSKQPFDGIARGIGDHGELLVETPEGLRLCHSGEVSVRVAP